METSILSTGLTSRREEMESQRNARQWGDLDANTARKALKLMERLDDHDDVQSVASNFNIPDEVMAEIEDG